MRDGWTNKKNLLQIYLRCVPINPIDSEEDIIVDQEQYNEQAAQMHKHGIDNRLNNYGTTNDNDNDNHDCGNFEMIDDDIDDDISKSMNPNVVVKNGYTTTHPNYKECTGMITDMGSLSIMNDGLVCIREELIQYQHNKNLNKCRRKSAGNGIQNSLVSLPAVDTSRQYTRLKPANSPSRKK